MTVYNILQKKGLTVFTVKEDDTILAALEVLAEYNLGAILILDKKGAIAGILSERDVARALPKAGGKLRQQPVSNIMTRDVVTCRDKDTLDDILTIMTDGKFRHIPVLKGKKLVGLISIGDVVKEKIAEAENEAKALKQYIASG